MGLKCACKAQDELHMGQRKCEDLAQDTLLVNTRLGFYFGLCIMGQQNRVFFGPCIGPQRKLGFRSNFGPKRGIGPNGPRVVCLLQESLEASQTCSPRMRVSFPWQDKCDLLRCQVAPPTCSFLAPKFNFIDSFFPPLFLDHLALLFYHKQRAQDPCIFIHEYSREILLR